MRDPHSEEKLQDLRKLIIRLDINEDEKKLPIFSLKMHNDQFVRIRFKFEWDFLGGDLDYRAYIDESDYDLYDILNEKLIEKIEVPLFKVALQISSKRFKQDVLNLPIILNTEKRLKECGGKI